MHRRGEDNNPGKCSGNISTGFFERCIKLQHALHAGVAELADALDLGSSAARRGSSSLFARTRVFMREWLSGRASPCQGECREFESRLPLHFFGAIAKR